MRRDRRDLPGVVGLDAADGDERVAALGQRVRGEVLQLAHLVAAERETGVEVLALGPDLGAAEGFGEAIEAMDGRWSEEEGIAGEGIEFHGPLERYARRI